MAKKVDVDLWMNRIERCRKAQEPYRDIWRDNIRKMDHQFKSNVGNNRHLVVNLIYAYVKTVIPSVFSEIPHIMADPKNSTTKNGSMVGHEEAHIAESLVNYYFEEFGWEKTIKQIIWDSLVMSHGVAAVGIYGEIVHIQPTSFFERASTGNLTIMPTREVHGKTSIQGSTIIGEFNETVRVREPDLRRVAPYNFFIDPDAKTIEDSPYVIERIVRSVKDIQSNPLYQNTSKLKGALSDDPWDASADGSNDSYLERVELFQIHDRRSKLFLVLASGYSKPLRVVENPYLDVIGGFPYQTLRFDENPEEFYAIPPVNAFSGIQDAIHMVVSKIANKIDHMKTVIVVDSTVGDIEEFIQDFRKADDFGIIRAQSAQGVNIIQDIPLSNSYYSFLQLLQRFMHMISGVSDYHEGIPQRSRTATEANILDTAFNIKIEEKIRTLEEFIADLAHMVVQITTRYADSGSYIPVLKDDGSRSWQKMDENSLWRKGQYIFRVDARSSMLGSRERRAAQARDILKLIGELPEVNRPELIRRVLRANGVRAEDRIVKRDHSGYSNDTAIEENILILNSEQIDVSSADDHQHHLAIHARLAADHPEVVTNYRALKVLSSHMEEHRKLLDVDVPFASKGV